LIRQSPRRLIVTAVLTAAEVGLTDVMAGVAVVAEVTVSAITCVMYYRAIGSGKGDVSRARDQCHSARRSLQRWVPLVLTDEGLKLTLTPEGTLLAATATLPVSPPTNPTVMVLVTVEPLATETAAGAARNVKLGSAVTVSVSVAVSVVEPLVPVTVTVAAPTVAVSVAVSVSVLPDEPVTEDGLKRAVSAGRQATDRKYHCTAKAIDRRDSYAACRAGSFAQQIRWMRKL